MHAHTCAHCTHTSAGGNLCPCGGRMCQHRCGCLSRVCVCASVCGMEAIFPEKIFLHLAASFSSEGVSVREEGYVPEGPTESLGSEAEPPPVRRAPFTPGLPILPQGRSRSCPASPSQPWMDPWGLPMASQAAGHPQRVAMGVFWLSHAPSMPRLVAWFREGIAAGSGAVGTRDWTALPSGTSPTCQCVPSQGD